MWLLSDAGIKVYPYQQKGSQDISCHGTTGCVREISPCAPQEIKITLTILVPDEWMTRVAQSPFSKQLYRLRSWMPRVCHIFTRVPSDPQLWWRATNHVGILTKSEGKNIPKSFWQIGSLFRRVPFTTRQVDGTLSSEVTLSKYRLYPAHIWSSRSVDGICFCVLWQSAQAFLTHGLKTIMTYKRSRSWTHGQGNDGHIGGPVFIFLGHNKFHY